MLNKKKLSLSFLLWIYKIMLIWSNTFFKYDPINHIWNKKYRIDLKSIDQFLIKKYLHIYILFFHIIHIFNSSHTKYETFENYLC